MVPRVDHPEFQFADYVMWYVKDIADMWTTKLSIGSILGVYSSLFRGDSWLVACLSIMMIVDWILGVTFAFCRGKLTLKRLHRGIMKFLAYYLSILVIGIVNVSVSRSTGIDLPILDLFVSYLIITESISVTNYLAECGIPIPSLLMVIIGRLKDKTESAIDSAIGTSTQKDDSDDDSRPDN